jgi:hypothetical protein
MGGDSFPKYFYGSSDHTSQKYANPSSCNLGLLFFKGIELPALVGDLGHIPPSASFRVTTYEKSGLEAPAHL